MKTSEENSKPATLKGKKVMTKNVVTRTKSGPSEEEIREKAEEIYYQRIDRGEYGSAEDDWNAAEAYLRDSQD